MMATKLSCIVTSQRMCADGCRTKAASGPTSITLLCPTSFSKQRLPELTRDSWTTTRRSIRFEILPDSEGEAGKEALRSHSVSSTVWTLRLGSYELFSPSMMLLAPAAIGRLLIFSTMVPLPWTECAVDVLYVIGSFAYTAQMLSFTFVDCPQRGKRQALCGANVADVVGSMAIFVASIIQAIGYCSDDWPNLRTN
ncbi:unnamed protein product [Symbiodinium necroappetens]|uniref:Uncharacterized protein n=1 Tax=Symbiodinium necroappetens TaxID=1628268 RepID=A0A812NSV2_9DINO|nr:unnamed protein product [Symbiodinium necroappetens]